MTFDEVEIEIIAYCIPRGICPAVRLMRYTVERDTRRALAEWEVHYQRLVERAAHNNQEEESRWP